MNKVDLFRSMVSLNDGEIVTTSRKIAEVFGKRHSDVIRAIDGLDCSGDFRERSYALCFENSNLQNGKRLRYYQVTKDGMSFLVMGFKGKEAASFKEAYINAFNWMSKKIHQRDELDRELRDFSRRESTSVSAGSFHGRGLAQRRKEKAKLATELKEIKERLQVVIPELETMK